VSNARRRLSALATLLSVLSVASPARGDALTLSLDAPDGCPDRASVERRALSLSAGNEGPVHIEAHARIEERADGGFRLLLELLTEAHRGERILEAHDCASLGEAAAWFIALAIDPDLATRQPPPPEPRPTAEPARAPVAPRAARVPPPAQATHGAWWRAGIAGGFVSHGVVGAQGQLSAFAGLGKRWSYSELSLAQLFERSRVLTEGAAARFSGQALTLAQCAEAALGLHVAPCIGLIGERTVGIARYIVEGREKTVYWLQGAAVLKLFYVPRAPLELSVQGFAAVPITGRPRFKVEGLGTIAQASFVSYGMCAGIGARY
jgi:hypothetical protein